MRSNLVDIDVCLHHQTEKAWKVSTDGDPKTAIWFPKALGELGHVVGTSWTLTSPQPILEEKGLV